MPSDSAKESPLAPGAKLDGYELLWPVGEGGMASVWVARLIRKHGFEKLVAIKTILPKFAEDEDFQKMFLDEARIASRIDHPNVAHIHDLGEKDDILYLVMEYVDGDALTRLRKVINKKGIAFPVPIALRIMADVCAGLHAAHELKGADGLPLGVVHRDVSPQNILITTEGASKLIDFGVAKAAGRLTAETHTGYVKGKVQYMAPEQALGKNVDRRADVWAVGAVIYHLVANRPPFEAENQLALLSLLQRGRPPAPLPPTIPAPVADIIRRSLTHNAALRFQSATEMRSAIDKTGLAATPEQVAEFVKEHLGEMADRRRAAIASSIQGVEAGAQAIKLPPIPHSSTPMIAVAGATMSEAGGSTQRIDPKSLPQFAANMPEVAKGRPVPPQSEPRIGPPTPHSFVAAASTMAGIGATPPPMKQRDPALVSTQPFSAGPSSVVPNPGFQGLPPSSQSSLAASSKTTEPLPPLPPPESYDHGFSDRGLHESTNGGGSLGLASISASINARPKRNVPLIAGGIGGVIGLIGIAAIAITLGSGNGSGKKLDSEFSPLPSSTIAPNTPVTANTVPVPTPPPSAEELPEPPKTTDPKTPEPVKSAGAAASVPAPVAHPVTTGGPALPYRPPPTGSARRRPKVDDGF